MRISQRRDTCPGVHRNATHLVIDQLALARVQASADRYSQLTNRLDDCARTPDRPGWAVERGQETVTRSVNFSPAEASQLSSDDPMVITEQLSPLPVAERYRTLRRADDVSEQYGGEHTVEV